MGLDSPA